MSRRLGFRMIKYIFYFVISTQLQKLGQMDKSQLFIKECLLTRSFSNPEKPIEEKRLQDTLLLFPTDGGASTRLKRNKSKLNISASTLEKGVSFSKKHTGYKKINKNSKTALRNYIRRCKTSARNALKIAHNIQFDNKEALAKHLRTSEPKLWDALPQFSAFLPMYQELWVGYIRELLNIPSKIVDSTKLSINGSTALLKLSMADYNGAYLKVAESVNKNLEGIEGIVIWDSQKNFIMVTEGKLVDEIKIIPKKGTVFNLEIPLNEEDALSYTILGDRFKYRSSDRAGRKFKNRRCDDLLHYVSN